jgi:hypothetical protein
MGSVISFFLTKLGGEEFFEELDLIVEKRIKGKGG